MKVFFPPQSISKKLRIAISAIAILFLVQFAGTYFSSQKFIRGVTNLHEKEEFSKIIGELHQLTDALTNLANTDVSDRKTLKTSQIRFVGIYQQALTKLHETRNLEKAQEAYAEGIHEVEDRLIELNRSAQNFFEEKNLKKATSQQLLAKQFGIDVGEAQDRLRISVENESNRVFEKLYRSRYIPLIVSISLTLFFIFAALVMGLRLTNALTKSIELLIGATHQVAEGNLDIEAPVKSKDEIGLLAEDFNSMTRALKSTTVSRDYVETIINSLPDSLFVLSYEGKVRSVNPIAEKLVGSDERTLFYTSFSDLFPVGGREILLKLHSLRAGTAIHNHEMILKDSSGRLIPVSLSASSVREKIGRTTGFICVLTDITERRKIEAEKARAEQAERILVGAAHTFSDSIDYKTTLRNIVEFATPIMGNCSLIEVSGEKKENSRDRESSCENSDLEKELEFQPQLQSLLEKAVTTKKSQLISNAEDINDLVLRKNKVFSYIVTPLLFHNEAQGTLTIFSTDQKRKFDRRDLVLYEEIARRAAIAIENSRHYRQAQEAILSRDEFLSIASHELKTPLTALSLKLQIFRRSFQTEMEKSSEEKIPIPRKTLSVVSDCENQSKKIAALLDELLDLTRIRLGQLQLAYEDVDLVEIVQEVINRFKIEAAQKKISMTLVAPKSATGCWDEMRIDQVVTNLISNAIKYGNGKPIRMRIEADLKTDTIKFTIRDEGMGIAKDMHSKIFERFERAGISGKKISGLGLGLYITRQIVEAHDGRIRVESKPLEGSIFIVELPIRKSRSHSLHQATG